jgi:LemA protein
MSIRDELKARPGVSEEEIELVIERAARLKLEAEQRSRGASPEELKEIARELDIEPRFVDQALRQLREEQLKQRALEAEQKKRALARRLQRRRWSSIGAIVLLSALFLSLIAGRAGLASAERETAAAKVQLEGALSRQAELLPQLLAVAGGDTGALSGRRRAVLEARGVEEQLAASQALSEAMAEALAKLPPPVDEYAAQQRLSLQYEISGAQSRISVERRRYEEALGRWQAAAQGLSGRLAIGLSFADAPPD